MLAPRTKAEDRFGRARARPSTRPLLHTAEGRGAAQCTQGCCTSLKTKQRRAVRKMSDVAMELLSVTLTRAPLGLKLDAYGFLAAVLDTAEDATRRALRPCDELIGINGASTTTFPRVARRGRGACDLVGEYVEAGAFLLTLTFRRDPSLMCQPGCRVLERRRSRCRAARRRPGRAAAARGAGHGARSGAGRSPRLLRRSPARPLAAAVVPRPPGDDVVFESPGAPSRRQRTTRRRRLHHPGRMQRGASTNLDDAPPEDHISEPAGRAGRRRGGAGRHDDAAPQEAPTPRCPAGGRWAEARR